MSIIYLSGPITGVPDYKDKFSQAACGLEMQGFTVIDPSVETEGLKPQDYILISVARLMAADAVYMLKGWQTSKGAKIERLIAEYIGKEIIEL